MRFVPSVRPDARHHSGVQATERPFLAGGSGISSGPGAGRAWRKAAPGLWYASGVLLGAGRDPSHPRLLAPSCWAWPHRRTPPIPARRKKPPHRSSTNMSTRKAAPYRQDCCGEGEVYRHVYAEAWYGNQKVVAPVRHLGCCDQLQLPTGEWIPCEFSCEITMRKMPLWYWQDQGAGYSHRLRPAIRARPLDRWLGLQARLSVLSPRA